MGPLSTFFVGAGFGAVGEIGFWLGGCGQAQGLPVRERLRGKGETARVGGEGGGRACACGDLVGLGGVWVGGVRSVGHLANIGTRSVRDIVGGGGVAGAEPPHKGGPNRPDRTEGQFLVLSFEFLVVGDWAVGWGWVWGLGLGWGKCV